MTFLHSLCMLCSKSSQSLTVSLFLVDKPITCDQSIASYHISSVVSPHHSHNRERLLLKLSWKHLAGSFVAPYHNFAWCKSDSPRVSWTIIFHARNFPQKITTNLLQILWQQEDLSHCPLWGAAVTFKLISGTDISSISHEVALWWLLQDDD